MDNPKNLATQSTQDGDKQNKNTTQYVLDTTSLYANKQIKICGLIEKCNNEYLHKQTFKQGH